MKNKFIIIFLVLILTLLYLILVFWLKNLFLKVTDLEITENGNISIKVIIEGKLKLTISLS